MIKQTLQKMETIYITLNTSVVTVENVDEWKRKFQPLVDYEGKQIWL